MFGRTNYDKLILSSGKSTSINNIIKHIVKKKKLNLKIDLDKYNSKKTLIGNNEIAQKKLKWLPKKNIYIAAEEIYQYTINNRNKYR